MKKLVFVLLGVGFLLTSCNKVDLAPLGMIIEGTVIDQKTGEILSGVSVEIVSRDSTRSVTTESDGFFTFPALPAGAYTVNFSLNGYLTKITWVSSYDMSINSATEELVVNDLIRMNPLSESLSFTALKYVSGISVAAANAPYMVRYTESGNAPVSGMADENGLVSISNLPYQSTCYIEFDFNENGIRYKFSRYYYSTNNQENSSIIYGTYDNGIFAVVSSNALDFKGNSATDFKVDDPVVITFTQPVDVESALITTNFTGPDTWSEGNTKLTVTPDPDLNPGSQQYYVYVELYNDIRTQFFSNVFYFYTEE